MKKMLLLFGMMTISFLCFAQVSKQQAVQIVMDSVLNRDTANINVYMEPLLQTESYYKLSLYDSIQSPYSNYWLFFIDDMPEYGWGHDCRYVFVNTNSGAIITEQRHTPPLHYKSLLAVVSESIALSEPSINPETPQLYQADFDYPSNDGKFALLFSGGELGSNNHSAFWNALCHSYYGLIENGFKRENIFVLSCDGDSLIGSLYFPEEPMYICNSHNIEMIMDTLSIIMQEDDILYVYGTMHGDPDGNNTFLYLWNGERLYDYQLAKMLSRINCSQYIVNFMTCYSGGMADDILSINNDVKKTVLTSVSDSTVSFRFGEFIQYTGMDVYNYLINSSLRNYHPNYLESEPWNRGRPIGQLEDSTLFALLRVDPYDINFDLVENEGNDSHFQDIGEVIKYTAHFEHGLFALAGIKHVDCGFKEDLLSLRGITGKVISADTVNGNFHIEDTLSICADTLMMDSFAKFYLFDADLIIEDTASLIMGDTTAIIARSGNCRVIVRGSMTLGNGVTFEACDGATLELIFKNNADLSVSNATFINCDLVLPGKNLSFSNCHFIGTPFLADLSMYKLGNNTVTLMNCDFVPNGKTIPEAIYIKQYPHYLVHGCSIDATGAGSFVSGIAIFNSGNNMGSQNISNNSVKGCMSGGVLMYASYGNITANVIEGNGQGVKLYNNCNIGQFMGNCQATTGTETQYIHDNGTYEVFLTANCVPETFIYNHISDDDNVPFVYHDITAYYVVPGVTPRSDIDVSMNYWGSNFTPSTHLYTNQNLNGFVYQPYWVMGNCANIENINASALVSEADSLNAIGEYASAKSLYLQVIDNYPNTISAETALKTLLVLEEHAGNNYNALKGYYQTNSVIASNESLGHLASSLANKCDEKLGNYAEAIGWYENVLTNPATSFNDSIFASIDLGDLYLRLGEDGGKMICGKWVEYQPRSLELHKKQTEKALELLPRIGVELNTYHENVNEEHQPVTDLNVQVDDDDAVSLTWSLPFGQELMPMTLSWTASESALDSCAFGHDSFMAQLFDSQDLRNVIGWKIDSLLFNKTSDWTYALYVWKKELGGQMDVVYNQLIPDGLPIGENIIRLEEGLNIAPNSQYWIGYKATFEEGQHGRFPFSTDRGPVVEGKGGLMMDANHPTTWYDSPYSNLWMKVFVSNQENGKYFDRFLGAGLDGYRIYRDGQLIKDIPYSFVTYFTDTEFTKGFDVEYCVTAVYGEEESEPVCATAVITGIEEARENDGITIAPNPTNSFVRIGGITVSELQIYNTMGQLVKTVQNTNEVDLLGLTPGIYSLRIKDIQGLKTNKKVVVKQH